MLKTVTLILLFIVTLTGFKVIVEDFRTQSVLLSTCINLLLESKEVNKSLQNRLTEMEKEMSLLKLQNNPGSYPPQNENPDETGEVPEF